MGETMNTLLGILLQCGAFLLIPLVTFGVGLWLIVRFVGTEKRMSQILVALLIGISFLEASTIGMLIDPRGGWTKFPEIIKTSIVIGAIVTISVLVFAPILRALMNLFK
jgi:hypothetical protein